MLLSLFMLLFVQTAQDRSPVPPEVVSTLMRGQGGMGAPPPLTAAPPPDGFPVDVLPPGATPRLSGTSERGMVVIAEVPGLRDAGSRSYLESLRKVGWNNAGAPRTGFVDTVSPSIWMLCRGDQTATVQLAPRLEGGVYARATVTQDARRGCGPRPMGVEAFFADVDVPALPAPAGMRHTGGGSGSSSNEWHSSARLTGPMTAADIAAHYRALLVDAGWQPRGAPVAQEQAVIMTFALPSRVGDVVWGLFVVTPAAGQAEVFVRVARVGPAGGRGGR